MCESSTHSNKILPSINGQIDWDRVAPSYHQYILSPYAPQMLEEKNNQPCRNLLINYLNNIPADEFSKKRILDFGCGPGNLIPNMGKKPARLVGVDKSRGSINIACAIAQENEIDAEFICDDILNIRDEAGFDLIISSNSILPGSREEVIAIFKKLHSLLLPDGKLLAILPSFDTTMYLNELRVNNNETVDNILVDEETLAYADDGHHLQCYHTPQSIRNETSLSGLKLIADLRKVYYPWELCRQFGYGYFPQSEEEIWDWFMVAEKATL